MIDLRSDTVTKPTNAMREAMHAAEVGDDVFGEDPSALELQHRVAELLGKEDALFVPSGVMGNQLAIKVLTQPGDEVIVDRSSHIFNYESGGPAVLSGVQLHVVDGDRGVLTAAQVRKAIRPGAYWDTPTRLVCLENTINKAGGRIYPIEATQRVAEAARDRGLYLHLDGARLWNASAATGISEREFAAPFDTVTVCMSKGLGAPVGSLIAGSRERMESARRYRKMFGGGMRQIGMLAAAGLYAIEHHRAHLPEDHRKARRLAEAIHAMDSFSVDLDSVETNIVLFDLAGDLVDRDADVVLETLAEDDLYLVPFGPRTLRATLHRDVTMDDVERAVNILKRRFG
ncbi:MAG: GntG family PLP-dependent aldolase [Rhodothermales bacterium]